MRIILRGGTDAGSMALFDRAALPRDYKMPPFANADYAGFQEAEQLCVLETSSDGEFNIALLLDEELRPIERELGIMRNRSRLQLPSGTLHFSGIEFVFWAQGLEKYPHMGQTEQVAAGVYQVEVFEIKYPEGWDEEKLEARIGSADYQNYLRGTDRSCLLGCVAAFSLLSLAATLWVQSFIGAIVSAVGLFAMLFLLKHERKSGILFGQVAAHQRIVEDEFPGWVVRLMRLDSADDLSD